MPRAENGSRPALPRLLPLLAACVAPWAKARAGAPPVGDDVGAAWDLDLCVSKDTYDEDFSCPPRTAAACWSWRESRWACWSFSQVPLWFSDREKADGVCKSWPMENTLHLEGPGLYYSGACTFYPNFSPPLMPSILTWDDAYTQADATLKKMTRSEKYLLMKGLGWEWPEGQEIGSGYWDLLYGYYVGNTVPIPRLNIPSMNFQDNSAGFRPYWHDLVGTVVGWPCSLALGATFDPKLVRLVSLSIAQEFIQKGANAILGPGVNIHRSAWNGRNFEYMGGEDPYLASKLAEVFVESVQSQGLMSVVKHWVFNEQETFREEASSNVNKKTAWELYYPPFQAAVDAGVSAAMCSYNRINGVYACSNAGTLKGDLKGAMGFRGFVQSDWWATRSTAVVDGLDQDMPGISDPGKNGNYSNFGTPESKRTWFDDDELDKLPETAIDGAARRVLASIRRMRLQEVCSVPNCTKLMFKNATNAPHVALARIVAAESMVLLRNEGGVLPLNSSVKTIAIVGSASVARPYDPAGAGQDENNGVAGAWNTGDFYSGGGSGHVAVREEDLVTPLAGITAAAKERGVTVFSSTANTTQAAVTMAKKADVTIVVGGAKAGEAEDRHSLRLEDGADEQIEAVVQVAKRTIVLMMVPGAVVMPWRNAVDAIFIAFAPGQQAGNAFGDVLFGAVPPVAKLPITLPATENDTIRIDPEAKEVDYSEGLKTGYRSGMAAAYPFGHGLTYTTFTYGAPQVDACDNQESLCVTMPVLNAGLNMGATVAQLYLEFDPVAGYPTPILRGFQKTGIILPGGTHSVTFVLTGRDLSYFDDQGSESWTVCKNVTAHIGESSADIRHQVSLEQYVPLVRAPAQGGGGSWLAIMAGVVFLFLLIPLAWACWRMSKKGKSIGAEASDSDDDDEEESRFK